MTGCNPFLIPGGEEPKLPGRLYAVLDQAEIGDSGLHHLTFGGVDADWFDARTEQLASAAGAGDIVAVFEPMPLFLLEIELSTDAVLSLRRRGTKPLTGAAQEPAGEATPELVRALLGLERRWTMLALGAGAAGRLYRNLFGEPEPVSLAAVSDPALHSRQRLNATDPLRRIPDATEAEIRASLSALAAAGSVEDVAVYDVGQGAAHGLISGGRVSAYFDFGGGVTANKRTFPKALKQFCFCHAQHPIILSHWDHDHWSSSGRDTRAYASTWIAPRQSARRSKKAPHHGALVAAIRRNGGTLRIWPRGLASLTVGQCSILKCTGTSKNASGLALEVSASAPNTGLLPMLMPADAGYADLPTSAASSYDAIVCPHHGGRSNSPTVPHRPSGVYPRLAYSYGRRNTHKHPLKPTWQAHDRAAWIDPRAGHPKPGEVRNTADRKPTGLGHIGFNWGRAATPPVLPCGATCQLQIQQF